jgi:hypothetical protein
MPHSAELLDRSVIVILEDVQGETNIIIIAGIYTK